MRKKVALQERNQTLALSIVVDQSVGREGMEEMEGRCLLPGQVTLGQQQDSLG
jgi:hypothetical protein